MSDDEALARLRDFAERLPDAFHWWPEWRQAPREALAADIGVVFATIDRLTAERDEARDLAFRVAFPPDSLVHAGGLYSPFPDVTTGEWLAEARRTRGQWPVDPARDDIYGILDDHDALGKAAT